MKTITPVPKAQAGKKLTLSERSDNTTLEKTRLILAKIQQNNIQVKELRSNNLVLMRQLGELLAIDGISLDELNDI